MKSLRKFVKWCDIYFVKWN